MDGQDQPDDVISSPRQRQEELNFVSGETPCPYLPDRLQRSEAYVAPELAPDLYEHLMARGFRRSGRIVYRPRCRGCDACVPLRVPVASFRSTASMKRVWARNREQRVEVAVPQASAEKFDLFTRYLDHQHDESMPRSFETFAEFLHDSPTDTLEFCYFLGKRLIGVSVADRCPQGLSTVYMYFEPELAGQSLGTYSILREIEFCRQERLAYYYLGYWVAGSKTMDYKARFRPNERLERERVWVPFRD